MQSKSIRRNWVSKITKLDRSIMGKSEIMSSIQIEDGNDAHLMCLSNNNNETNCEIVNGNCEKEEIHLPEEMSLLESQVGGHCFNGKTIGKKKNRCL